MNELTLFDYASLPINDAMELKASAERIKIRLKRGAEDIIENGRDLLDSKNKLGHGKFEGWIKSEFGLGLSSAKRFIQVFEKFGDKSPKLGDLKPCEIYLLAQNSTPDEVREVVIERIENGEKVDLKEIERLKQQAKTLEIENEDFQRQLKAIPLLHDENFKLSQKLVDERQMRNKLVDGERAKMILENQQAIAEANRIAENAQGELERLKREQQKAIKDGVDRKLFDIETELEGKRRQIELQNTQIEKLRETERSLFHEVGHLQIHKKAIEKIKDNLSFLTVSFSDAFDTGTIPNEVTGDWSAIYDALSKLLTQMAEWRGNSVATKSQYKQSKFRTVDTAGNKLEF